ncbi:MAG: hypothetical protein Q8R96_04030 [Bacteroidota bacterium]|nr:hypothetical protein [Bacteroidota bacterium]
MRTSQLNRFMGAFIALTLTAGIAVSSNNFSEKGRNNTKNATCVNQISGLSQDQKDQMTSMESQYQASVKEKGKGKGKGDGSGNGKQKGKGNGNGSSRNA